MQLHRESPTTYRIRTCPSCARSGIDCLAGALGKYLVLCRRDGRHACVLWQRALLRQSHSSPASARDSLLHAMSSSRVFPPEKTFPIDEYGQVQEDYSMSHAEIFRARAATSRERYIAAAETTLLQKKIKECYNREGVNHFERCKELVDAYLERVQDKRNTL